MKIALFTIVKNENIFLPIWLKYHSRYFNAADIYILDNDSDDGSTDGLENVFKVSNERAFNVDFLLQSVQAFQTYLLEQYDYVLFSEVDELIFFDGYDSVSSFIIDTGEKDTYRCSGYEIVQQDDEADLVADRPIILQRSKWYKSLMYCKSLLTRIPLRYGAGFHRSSYNGEIEKKFILIHLHKMDLKIAVERNIHRLNKKIDEKAMTMKQGWQNFTSGEKAIRYYFKKMFSPMTGIEDIPERIKELI